MNADLANCADQKGMILEFRSAQIRLIRVHPRPIPGIRHRAVPVFFPPAGGKWIAFGSAAFYTTQEGLCNERRSFGNGTADMALLTLLLPGLLLLRGDGS